jgi:hypothetical protein
VRRRLAAIAALMLTALALIGGFYALSLEQSPSISTYLGGIVLVFAGLLMKFLLDISVDLRKTKEAKISLLGDLLTECEGNLELVTSQKIRWPQVHFKVNSYKAAEEKTLLTVLSSDSKTRMVEAYGLISQIEKRKFTTFDTATDTMLERLAQILPQIIFELRDKVLGSRKQIQGESRSQERG